MPVIYRQNEAALKWRYEPGSAGIPPAPEQAKEGLAQAVPHFPYQEMTRDFALVESIVRLSTGRTLGGELAFTYPSVLDVIRICTKEALAVLGVEVFLVTPEGYFTEALSTYDLLLGESAWSDFVDANNGFADQFVRQNPAGDDHMYLLTVSSHREVKARRARL